jgi:glycosyltransferase involved in cell wall biosynthesis
MNINPENNKAIGYLQDYNPRIIVMMPVKNAKNMIMSSLLSLANQTGVRRKMLVLISDDHSQDHWETDSNLKEILSDKRFLIIKPPIGFNDVHQNRNFLINFSKRYAKNLEILLRLDADDLLEESNIVQIIENYFFSSTVYFYQPDTRTVCHLLLMGNTLSCYGLKLNRINCASNRLKNSLYLLEQLDAMRHGIPEAELPSCNLIWKPELPIWYPALKSAEDHLLLTHCLLRYKNNDFYLEEEKLYANYSLSGDMTANNKRADIYLQSRQFIFNYASWNYGQN